MNIRLNEGQEYRTQLPVVGWVDDADSKPTVLVGGMGAAKVRREGDGWRFEFHVMSPGTYRLEVRDADEAWARELVFAEQRFLEFGPEFGSFTALFAVVMTGVVLWTRRLMKRS